jgi:hypothetical protein
MSEQFPEQQFPVIPPTVGENDLVRIIKSFASRLANIERRTSGLSAVRCWDTLTATTPTTLVNATWTRLNLTAFANGGNISQASNSIVPQETGWYDVVASIVHGYTTAATIIGVGVDIADVVTDPMSTSPTADGGGGYQMTMNKAAGVSHVPVTGGPLYIVAGQFIRLWGYQNTGANLALAGSSVTFLKAVKK